MRDAPNVRDTPREGRVSCPLFTNTPFGNLGQNWWDWTEKGRRLKELLKSGIIKWVQARADTELRAEVAALQRFFAKSFIVLLLIFTAIAILRLHNVPVVQQIMFSLSESS
jgi:hypothetical protein